MLSQKNWLRPFFCFIFIPPGETEQYFTHAVALREVIRFLRWNPKLPIGRSKDLNPPAADLMQFSDEDNDADEERIGDKWGS